MRDGSDQGPEAPEGPADGRQRAPTRRRRGGRAASRRRAATTIGMSKLSARRSARPMARPTIRRRRRPTAAGRHGRQLAHRRRLGTARSSPRRAQQLRCSTCSARAPLLSACAALCSRPPGAVRARVQTRAGSRPGTRAAVARPATERVGAQPPGRHRRSRCASIGRVPRQASNRVRTAWLLRPCAIPISDARPILTHAVRTLAAGAEASAGFWGCGACGAVRGRFRRFRLKSGCFGRCAGTRLLGSFERLVMNPMDGT